jgi:hypothetical protein
MYGEGTLEAGGRRSAGGSYRKQDAADQHLKAEGASCVVETCGAWRRRRVSVCADDAGRAGGAVLRRPKVAPKIVMFELAREQKERVERDAEERSPISRPVSHLIDDITGR